MYVPSTGKISVSQDVVFDEDFMSTVAYSHSLIPGGLTFQPPTHTSFSPNQLEFTENTTKFATNEVAPGILDADIDTLDPAFIPQFDETSKPSNHIWPEESIPEVFDEEYIFEGENTKVQSKGQKYTHHQLPHAPRRSKRIHKNGKKQVSKAHHTTEIKDNNDTPPDYFSYFNTTNLQHLSFNELHQQTRYAFQTEVQSVEGAKAEDFLPAPNHWKHITKLPDRLKYPWLQSLKAELVMLIKKMKTFEPITPTKDDVIIPTTTKFRTKLKADGTVEKLKARVCLRGDKQIGEWDTWCKIGGFSAVKHFLALAAHHKCRVYQLDYIGAFLQADAQSRVITILPAEWKEFFPDLAEYFGVPLLILKSLYGQKDSMSNWDQKQSQWLINTYGFSRCPSEESIYQFHHDGHFIYMINIVDDQLYFSNHTPLRKDFEEKLSKDFLVELLGQAHWYLQARLNQLANFSIILDQSRYMALIASRFLPQHSTNNITSEEKTRYSSPLPASFVPTKEDQSKTYSEVKDLEQKYGFQYSSATGMLIFLMNTTITLQYGIRKLSKFNAMPGKQHFKALIHLLHHVRTHRTEFGLRFYSPDDSPPIYRLVQELYPKFDPSNVPLLLFTDSSWYLCFVYVWFVD